MILFKWLRRQPAARRITLSTQRKVNIIRFSQRLLFIPVYWLPFSHNHTCERAGNGKNGAHIHSPAFVPALESRLQECVDSNFLIYDALNSDEGIVGDKADQAVRDESETEPKCFIKSCWLAAKTTQGFNPPPPPPLTPSLLPLLSLFSLLPLSTSGFLLFSTLSSSLLLPPLFLRGLWEHHLLANIDITQPPPLPPLSSSSFSSTSCLCTGVTPSKWLFLLQFINSGSPGGPGKFHINFDQTDVSLAGPQPPLSTRGNSSAQSQAEKTRGKQCK